MTDPCSQPWSHLFKVTQRFCTLLILPAILFILMTGRTEAADSGLKEERLILIPASKPIPSLSGKTGEPIYLVNFQADKEHLKKIYVLKVRIQSPERPELFLNGKSLDIQPVTGKDGVLYYRVQGNRFVLGKNRLELRSAISKKLQIEEVEANSLIDPFEEDHFGWAFGEPKTWVQPETLPDQEKYDAKHYDLETVLNLYDTVVDSTLTLIAESLDSTLQNVPLDFAKNNGQMAVQWVDQGPSTATLPFNHQQHASDPLQDRLYITLPALVPEGTTFAVRVHYTGRPSTEAAVFGSTPYNVSTHSGTPVLYTMSQPYSARTWWPCKDVPADKATMDLHVTCPSGSYKVISNGKLLSTIDHGNGTQTFHWSETYPMATYLASIACTNYQASSRTYTSRDGTTTMEVVHYLYPENYSLESNAVDGTLEVLEFYADLFGEYPFLSEKYATASWNISFGMEHQTATSLPGRELDEGGYGRRNVHELAHMWFGDAITMGHYDHVWLNEGFATYCEALWYEHANGEAAYHNYVNSWSVNTTTPIVNPNADDLVGGLVYRKGAWVLHMLRHVAGDEAFFDAVRSYINDPDLRYDTALSIDLQNVFETETGMDLDYFFQQWLYRAGRPSYQWSWSSHVEGASTILDLTIQQTQSGDAYTMPIDFEVSLLSGTTEIVTVFNNQKTQSFAIDLRTAIPVGVRFDPDNWVLKGSATQQNVMPWVALHWVRKYSGAANSIQIQWTPSSDPDCSGYEIYRTDNLSEWNLVADSSTVGPAASSHIIGGMTPGQAHYFAIRAMGSTKSPGPFSDVYGSRLSSGNPEVLIVDGYDRWDTQAGRGGSFTGSFYYGQALNAHGTSFDTCDNDDVGSGVNLGDYNIVLYSLGEESTTHYTFSSSEQDRVEAFLDAGGRLFVSGAEIGWDLDYQGSSSDKAFYNNYLKADYAGDDSNTFQCMGTAGSLFSGVGPFHFGTGEELGYYIDYADQLNPYGGSIPCLTYVGGTADTAAVQYNGDFKVINMGFPFDTIIEESARNQIMAAALEFFGLSSTISMWALY